MLTIAGFNRRMRKTACPVVWKAHGAQSPWAHPITKSARLPPHRSWIDLVLRMAVALWAKWASTGFPAMRKAMGRGQDV